MDILAWAVKNHQRFYCRMFLWLTYKFLCLVSGGVMTNSAACMAAAQELSNADDKPQCYIVLGAGVDPGPDLSSIPKGVDVVIGGCKQESELARQYSGSRDYHFLDHSIGTRDEAQRALDYAVGDRSYINLAIKAQDIHCLRAVATFIQELMDRKWKDVRIIPKSYLPAGREGLPRSLKDLAVMVEAWKLWLYQRRGHVAKLETIIKYVRLYQEVNSSLERASAEP